MKRGEEELVTQKYQLLTDDYNENHYLITINNDLKLDYENIEIDRFSNESNENYSLFFFDYDQLKSQLDTFIKNISLDNNPNPKNDDNHKNEGKLQGKKISNPGGNGHGKGKHTKTGYVSPELKGEDDDSKLKQADEAEMYS